MKIVAFYKVFDGGEWLEASIKSIMDHVDHVFILNSDISWSGIGENNCRYIAERMANENDNITSVNLHCADQIYQYMHGFKIINELFKPDYIMLVDADEIWEYDDIVKAKKIIELNPDYDAYRCNVRTYIKSPYYRIEPAESIEPVVFVRGGMNDYGQLIRCCDLKNHICMQGVFFHHFSYVRKSFHSVMMKFFNSHHSEKQPTEPLDYWISKWNALPAGKNLHPAIGFQKCWDHVEVIKKDKLPEVLQKNDFEILTQAGGIENMELPDGLINRMDMELLYDHADVDLAVELGTFRCASAIILAKKAKRVFSVDSYGSTDNCETLKYDYFDNVKTVQGFQNIKLMNCPSWDSAKYFDNKSIDLLFVDAEHGYDSIHKDFYAFKPKMKVGGLILFHDYDDRHPDTMEAIDHIMKENPCLDFAPVSNRYYTNENPSSIQIVKVLYHE